MLRETREKGGLTSQKLARKLGWSLTTISRMENGERTSTTTDVIQYAVMCGMNAKNVWPLVEFARVAERKQGYYLSDQKIGGSLQSLIFHETSADRVITYEPQVCHGLLQTPAYARALITALTSGITEDRVAGAVRTRMERKRILSLPRRARFTFYLHEQALRLQVGTEKIMHEQLLQLVLMAALDNITLRIVPSTAGERSAIGGAFQMMKFDHHPSIVYVDNLGDSGLILEDGVYVHGYGELMPMLNDVALDEEESRTFAADLADEYDRGSHRHGADSLAHEQLQRCRGRELRGGGVVGPPIYE